MGGSNRSGVCLSAVLCTMAVVFLATQLIAQVISLDPAKMPAIGTVDERFDSYNIEMVEVIGGRFWKPYGSTTNKSKAQEPAQREGFTPAGIDPNLYEYRAPIDLSNPRLRKLAAALGPAYIRVSGTWANSTYFHDSDDPAPKTPPAGFNGILTRGEWRGVLDFAHAVDAKLVTSFAISPGVRDTNGIWTPVEADKILRFTKSAGGSIAAAEMFNEPTFAGMGGAPRDYDAEAYGRDFHAFREFIRKADPQLQILGPGSIGEVGLTAQIPGLKILH